MEKGKKKIKKSTKLEDVKLLQSEIKQLTSDLQRSHAEMVNFKRRTDEEKSVLMQTAKASVVTNFIEVIDNFERVTSSIPKELTTNEWAKGVIAVAKQIDSVLGVLGVEKINTEKNTLFDPNIHEAVVVDEAEGDIEVVAEGLQSGYKIGDSVLRSAKVRVTYIKK